MQKEQGLAVLGLMVVVGVLVMVGSGIIAPHTPDRGWGGMTVQGTNCPEGQASFSYENAARSQPRDPNSWTIAVVAILANAQIVKMGENREEIPISCKDLKPFQSVMISGTVLDDRGIPMVKNPTITVWADNVLAKYERTHSVAARIIKVENEKITTEGGLDIALENPNIMCTAKATGKLFACPEKLRPGVMAYISLSSGRPDMPPLFTREIRILPP